MVVEFRQTTDKKDFEKLSDGAFFGFGGGFYIKMAYDICEENEAFNAVDIESGEPAFFDNDDEVTEYPKTKIVIE